MSNYLKHKMRTKSPVEIAGWILLAIIGFTGLVILFGFGIMWLWNWLMPELFGLPVITFWQGLGLCLLSKIFFSGFGGGGGKSGDKQKWGKSKTDSDCEKSAKNEISKWKFYDKFWNEEGNAAFEAYIANKQATDSTAKEEENTAKN